MGFDETVLDLAVHDVDANDARVERIGILLQGSFDHILPAVVEDVFARPDFHSSSFSSIKVALRYLVVVTSR